MGGRRLTLKQQKLGKGLFITKTIMKLKQILAQAMNVSRHCFALYGKHRDAFQMCFLICLKTPIQAARPQCPSFAGCAMVSLQRLLPFVQAFQKAEFFFDTDCWAFVLLTKHYLY